MRVPTTRIPGASVARATPLNVPVCTACALHAGTWNNARNEQIGYTILLGAIALLALLAGAHGLGVIGALVAIAIGYWKKRSAKSLAARRMSVQCACPQAAVQYFGWNGSVHGFDFAQRGYAVDFMEANAQQLANLTPEAQHLLQLRGQQRLDEAQERARADEGRVLVWVARMESAKGPAGRRTTLQAGLDALPSHLRQRLMLEASRLEVRAALDKAENFKSPAAKLRTLHEALDTLRRDSIPDELQVQQIQWLEAAIAEIEGGLPAVRDLRAAPWPPPK